MEAVQGRLDKAQAQIQQKQTQIERLQKSLQDSVQILQQRQNELQVSVHKASEEAMVARDTAELVDTKVTGVKSSVASVSESVQPQAPKEKNPQTPPTIPSKGNTLTPTP